LWGDTARRPSANLGEVVLSSGGDFKTTVNGFQALFDRHRKAYFGGGSERRGGDGNIVRNDTRGKIGAIDAKYELLPRGQYEYHIPESQLSRRPEFRQESRSRSMKR